MGAENSVDHYAAVLADLEAQKVRIDAAIATIRALQSGTPIPTTPVDQASGSGNSNGGGATLQLAIDTFHKLTLAQSVKKLLSMRPRKPLTTQEIVELLREGGQQGADGANFSVVVTNSLNRMSAADGELTKVRRGVWGLKSWYTGKQGAE